jgi:hypothetical protein
MNLCGAPFCLGAFVSLCRIPSFDSFTPSMTTPAVQLTLPEQPVA